jgi:hypothetical protein
MNLVEEKSFNTAIFEIFSSTRSSTKGATSNTRDGAKLSLLDRRLQTWISETFGQAQGLSPVVFDSQCDPPYGLNPCLVIAHERLGVVTSSDMQVPVP